MALFAVTTDFVNGTVADADEVNANFEDVEDVINNKDRAFGLMPIGVPTGWLKTFGSISMGTATTDTLNKLVDTAATFQTDGVTEGRIIHNTTDDTFAIVDVVESETSIALRADTQEGSSVIDVFPDGNEAYVIYATPELPDQFYECNGQTLSDSESPYDGQALPDLNGKSGTPRFLRGSTTSGVTGGSESHSHTQTDPGNFVEGGQTACLGSDEGARNNSQTGTTSTLPSFYETVWIVRVK